MSRVPAGLSVSRGSLKSNMIAGLRAALITKLNNNQLKVRKEYLLNLPKQLLSVQVSLYVKGLGAAAVQNMAAKKNFAKNKKL